MRLTIMCFCGISTGILINMIQQHLQPGDTVKAVEYSKLDEIYNNSDVILLGPQLRHKYDEFLQKTQTRPLACGLISSEDYRTMNGEAIYQQAKALFATLSE